ncbi:MAG: ArsA family ATPase [Gammaproteobacteria bacterium]|nr:ArsA family ATPase [Gammaproteobacteria bacterium]MBT4782133.1 ArsA family ATPase [Gammaproteobacteria bacterium]MBT6317338.1 ArsA family ATPase [Gammaproteobacteria bacterium]MBT7764974.1 ArsA family ATPase [Gammaproteobacteria bacterium]MDG1180699.1 ArsA family ATPase [Gammaproteobacteria bacterium]
MLLALAQTKKILFFGGKGGVGKTTVSAATALARAQAGGKVLLVSTDPAHNLGHLFDRAIGSKPVRLAPGLDGLELDPDETVRLHLKEITSSLHKLMPVHLRGEVDKHMALSKDAPGMQEAALMERIAEVVEQGVKDYDLIVFDTAPSGHTARLMALPEMMSAWTEGLIKRQEKADGFAQVVKDLSREAGSDSSMQDKTFGDDTVDAEKMRESGIRRILHRRRLRFTHLRDQLSNAESTAFVIVLAAERLPILETIALHAQLQAAKVNVAALVVNKRSPADGGAFMQARFAQEQGYLEMLTEALPNLPRHDLFLLARDIVGLEALREFAEAI